MRRLATEQQRKAEEDIKRLTKEYAEMSEERRDNDRQVEELKQEADEIERKVRDSFRGLFNRGCTKLMGSLPPPLAITLAERVIYRGCLGLGDLFPRWLNICGRTRLNSMTCLRSTGHFVTRLVRRTFLKIVVCLIVSVIFSEVYMETLANKLGMQVRST